MNETNKTALSLQMSPEEFKAGVLGRFAEDYVIEHIIEPMGSAWNVTFKGASIIEHLSVKTEFGIFEQFVLLCMYHHNNLDTTVEFLAPPGLWPKAPRFAVEILFPNSRWRLDSLPVPTLEQARLHLLSQEESWAQKEWIQRPHQPALRICDLAL